MRMGDHYTCECGERVDPKGSHHYCPGTPDERIAALESDVERLKKIVVVLLSGATLPADERNALVAEWLGE